MYSELSGHSPIDKGVQAFSEKAADIVADIAVGDSVSIEQAIKEYVRDVYIKMTKTGFLSQAEDRVPSTRI